MVPWWMKIVWLPGLLLAAGSGHAATESSVLPLPIHSFGLAVSSSPTTAPSDTFPLDLLFTFEPGYSEEFAFGDTDHDGANELIFTGLANTFRIWEHQGGNFYVLQSSGASDFATYATDDLDQDGRSEIIGQVSGYVQVLESLDAASHPSELVWSSPYLSNTLGHPTTGDTDRDGRREIIHSVNGLGSTSGLAIFECTGDNSYELVFSTTLYGPGATAEKVIADFDRDGHLEIVMCGSPGWLHIFESPSDNTWNLIWREWTGMYNAYVIDAGNDTDGNGRMEIFLMGNIFTRSSSPSSSSSLVNTAIFESPSDNTFVRVADLPLNPGIGSVPSAIANVDGIPPDEYLARTEPGIRVYRASRPGVWDWVGSVFDIGGGVHAVDLNNNGIPEVVWPSTTSRILEHPNAATDSSFEHNPSRLRIIPNPCTSRSLLRFAPGVGPVTAVVVIDPRGRVVERRSLDGGQGPVVWQPRHLPNGIYFLRLQDPVGRTVASGRGTLVR